MGVCSVVGVGRGVVLCGRCSPVCSWGVSPGRGCLKMLVYVDDEVDVVFVEQLSLEEARAVRARLVAQIAAVVERIECLEDEEARERAVEAGVEHARELFDDVAQELLGGVA